MNGLKSVRPGAVAATALASLFVAAPALADKPESKPPAAESHAKNNKVKVDHAAGKKDVAGSPCSGRVFSRVFSTFNDRALYTPAPDGDFEAGASGWELGDGAAVAGESSSILLGAALGGKSLELADGGVAVSPEICVERGFPSFRFVTRSPDGGVLRVAVLYRGGKTVKKAGRVKARANWRVSRKASLAQGRFHVKGGQSATVQLRFTASGGSVRVDDVYIDPRLRR